jgi:hypothetical protein
MGMKQEALREDRTRSSGNVKTAKRLRISQDFASIRDVA